MYGAATKEELFRQMGTHHTPESLGSFRNAMKAYVEGKTYYESDSINETIDGRQIHVIMRIAFPEKGQLSSRALITVTDITERNRSISALKESEEKYRSLFEMSVDPIGITAQDGEIIDVNPAWLHLFGYKIDCLLNSNKRMAEDGSIAGYQSVVRDMTERKQLEEERIKTSKIESLGILAGGIAHDFNNILTSILGNISLSQEFFNEDKGKREIM